MLVRVATPMDVLRTMKNTARTIYSNNPKQAIEKGLTDAEGHPLDPRKTFKSGAANPDYGKILPEERLIQNIGGVAKSSDMKAPIRFRMILSERLAGKVDTPVFMSLKFRANPSKTQPTDGTLSLNEYSNLKFKPTDIDGFPGPEAVIGQFFKKDVVGINDLEDWHGKHEDDPTRMCIVCGDVDDVDPTPNQTTGNARITLTDENGDVDIPVWIPAHLRHLLNFGKGSRVYVVGRTAQQTSRNNEVRTMINAEGLYVIPKFRMAPDEVPERIVSKAEEVK
jgi:hypothetical protein